MRRKIIAGNWKLNGTITETKKLIDGLLAGNLTGDAEAVVCPPFTALCTAGKMLNNSKIAVGAQDMSAHSSGAFTGEVSAEMLLTVGTSYVILGHSERRQYHAESDSLVNTKAVAALRAGLTPIICVGETLEQRESGQMTDVIGTQVKGSLAGFNAEELKKIVVAYEPVWAIGTGKTATPDQAQEVHAFVRSTIAEMDSDAAAVMPILYGGSVKPANAKELLAQPDIDGALVGGAALKADDFIAIINAA